jgi:polyisoprenoid-binding protein YceI
MPFRPRHLPWLIPLLSIPLCANARDWQVDAGKSTLTFRGTYQNAPFAGRFAKFDAQIAFDASDPAKDRFDVRVQLASVATESEERDDALKGDDFFDAVKFPQAHFVTQSFAKGTDGALEAKGTLTIRDQSRPVVLKVKFAANGDSATLDVDTTLNRLDFNLGAGSDWADVGKEVPVHGHLLLSGK